MANIDATAKSSVKMGMQNKIDQDIMNIDAKLQALATKEQYFVSKIQYSENIISMCDKVLETKGFHPIQKMKARIAKKHETSRLKDAQSKLNAVQAKKNRQELKKLNKQIKRADNARFMENNLTIKKENNKFSFMQVKDGKVDMQSLVNRGLTKNLFDENGNPTPNFDRLKQIMVDYPQSITTLPDDVVKQLNDQKVKIKQKQGTMEFNGQTIDVVNETEKSGFEYMCGMAAAGFQLAEEQGRTLQSNPQSRTDFVNWKNQKEQELQNNAQANNKQMTKQGTRTYETTAQF